MLVVLKSKIDAFLTTSGKKELLGAVIGGVLSDQERVWVSRNYQKLANFIDKELKSSLELIPNSSSSDGLYKNLCYSTEPTAATWEQISNPRHLTHQIFARDQNVMCKPVDQPLDITEKPIEKVKDEDIKLIINDFREQQGMAKLDVPANKVWLIWNTEIRGQEVLIREWAEFRLRKLKTLLTERLSAAGIESPADSVDKIHKNRLVISNKPNDTFSLKAQNSGVQFTLSAKEILLRAIPIINEQEARMISIPLYAVVEALSKK
jgi:hypothetical protein